MSIPLTMPVNKDLLVPGFNFYVLNGAWYGLVVREVSGTVTVHEGNQNIWRQLMWHPEHRILLQSFDSSDLNILAVERDKDWFSSFS